MAKGQGLVTLAIYIFLSELGITSIMRAKSDINGRVLTQKKTQSSTLLLTENHFAYAIVR